MTDFILGVVKSDAFRMRRVAETYRQLATGQHVTHQGSVTCIS